MATPDRSPARTVPLVAGQVLGQCLGHQRQMVVAPVPATRAARVLGSLTVNMLVSSGHDDPPDRSGVFGVISVSQREGHSLGYSIPYDRFRV